MKKIFKWTLFAVATLSLAACGTGAQQTNSQQAKTEKAAKSSASDGQVEVSLKEGNTSNHLSSMTQKTEPI